MAPMLPPQLVATTEATAATNEKLKSKKKWLSSKKETVKKSPCLDETPDTKPLPRLNQEVIEAMELEKETLRQEEEKAERRRKQVEVKRLSKPLALPPKNLSPLDPSCPPLPPPKDDTVQEAEKEVLEIEPERLSLEEDYPNRTVNPDEIISSDYRQRSSMHGSNQWYFDEYSGIYRQNVPSLHQSMPNFDNVRRRPSSNWGTNASPMMIDRLSRSKSTLINNQPPCCALKLQLPEYFDNIRPSLSQSQSTSSLYIDSLKEEEEDVKDWPTPTTVDEVHTLKQKAFAMRDCRKQLDLCRLLMDAACKGETTVFVEESPIPGTPPVNTRYRQQDLHRKKKKDLLLDEVLVLEAQKILKKLALGGTVGHKTDGDAQFLLANCFGVGGLGLPLDRERAFSLYLHAAKQNHVESTYRAGVCYEIGIGTKKDYHRAIIFYKKAGTLSHVASMYKLAIIFLRGFCGQVPNTREAITWLQRAAALATTQNPHALYALAMFQFSSEFAENTNLIADPSYALELLHQSAKLKYLPSQVKLGELYEVGGPVDVDDALSIYWYTEAAKDGNADAALALSIWYLTGSSGILPQSDREAYLWARKAASYQYADRWTIAKAYFLIGMYVDRGIGVNDSFTENAKIWFQRSAALGHRGALEMMYKSNVNNNAAEQVASNA